MVIPGITMVQYLSTVVYHSRIKLLSWYIMVIPWYNTSTMVGSSICHGSSMVCIAVPLYNTWLPWYTMVESSYNRGSAMVYITVPWYILVIPWHNTSIMVGSTFGVVVPWYTLYYRGLPSNTMVEIFYHGTNKLLPR